MYCFSMTDLKERRIRRFEQYEDVFNFPKVGDEIVLYFSEYNSQTYIYDIESSSYYVCTNDEWRHRGIWVATYDLMQKLIILETEI